MSPKDAPAPAENNEPIAEDSGNGLDAKEQAQFDLMSQGEPAEIDDAPDTPKPDAPAPDASKPAPASAPAAAKAPAAPAAPKAGEKKEAPLADGDDDDDEADGKAAAPGKEGETPAPRRVNYNKFKREQDRANDLDAKFAKSEETRIRLEERTKLLLDAIATPAVEAGKPKEPDDPKPDAEKDLFAYVEWQSRQIEKLNARLEQTQQTTTQHVEHQNIQSDYTNDARQFMAKEPTFPQAYEALITSRASELKRVGYSQAQIKATIEGEERGIVQYAKGLGISPAEVIFQIAQDRGFNVEAARAKLAAPAVDPAAAAPAAGGALAPQKPTASAAQPGAAPAKPSVSEEIARIANGSESALSLSAIPGMPNTGLTPQAIANMSSEEFGDLLDTLSDAQKRAMLGD